jgi:Cof subfamily protein (haloacid dehalogenase superfamily)
MCRSSSNSGHLIVIDVAAEAMVARRAVKEMFHVAVHAKGTSSRGPQIGDSEKMGDSQKTSQAQAAVRLVIADVDGTLVTPDKVLTPRCSAAVQAVMQAGIAFTITSGRPPRGMKMLIDALRLQHPIAAFNGGVLVNPDLSVLRQYFIPADVAEQVIQKISQAGLDAWLYTDTEWYVNRAHAAHVDREEWTVKFPPVVVNSYDALLGRVAKIVGVSNDNAAVAACERDVQHEFGQQVSAARSQPYYLDVTHPNANKGTVVRMLSGILAVPEEEIATIGDMPNDILMFARSGISIAMGQASDEVKHAAKFVTASNQEDGFALAMERFVLGHTGGDSAHEQAASKSSSSPGGSRTP